MPRRVVRGVVARLSIVVAWTGTAATQAWAQDPPPESPPAAFVAPPPGYEPPPPPSPEDRAQAAPSRAEEAPPGFITLDRMDGTSRIGLQMGFNKIDEGDLDGGDVYSIRFNPHVQVLLPNRVVGVYGQMPITRAFNTGFGDATGIGNFELGAFFLPVRTSELILRAGFVAPTASEVSIDNLGPAFANSTSVFERMTDFILLASEYTTMRLSASTVQQQGMGFVRADGGFDVVVDRPSAAGDSPSVFFRANVAAGIRTAGADLAVELANLAAVNGDVTGGASERFIHTAAIGARTQGENQFHFGAVFPLDQDVRGDVWILSLGYLRAFN